MQGKTPVQIASFENRIFAHLAGNRLSEVNIRFFLDGEHHVAMDWMISSAVGEKKLLVDAKDRVFAVRVLEETSEL